MAEKDISLIVRIRKSGPLINNYLKALKDFASLFFFMQTTSYDSHFSSAKHKKGIRRDNTKQKQLPLQYGRVTREERKQYGAKRKYIKTRGLDDINAVVLLRRQGMLERRKWQIPVLKDKFQFCNC